MFKQGALRRNNVGVPPDSDEGQGTGTRYWYKVLISTRCVGAKLRNEKTKLQEPETSF